MIRIILVIPVIVCLAVALFVRREEPRGTIVAREMLAESGPLTLGELVRVPWTTTAFVGWTDDAIADYADLVRHLEGTRGMNQGVDGALSLAHAQLQTVIHKAPPRARDQHAILELREALSTLVVCYRLRRDFGFAGAAAAVALEAQAREQIRNGRACLRAYAT